MVSCDYGKSTSVDFSTGDRTAQVKWKKSVGAGRSKRWSLATMENRRAIFQQATARGRYRNDEECGRREEQEMVSCDYGKSQSDFSTGDRTRSIWK